MPDPMDLLPPAEFEGVQFPVSEAGAEGGHDGAKHKAYGRAGVDIEALGQKGFTGTLVCPFVNGLQGFEGIDVEPGLRLELLAQMIANPIGEFVHPLLGTMTAFMEHWRIKPSPTMRNGVILEIDWSEHRETAQLFVGRAGQTPNDAQQSVVSQARAADEAMEAITRPGTFTPCEQLTKNQLAIISQPNASATTVKAAVRTITDTADSNLALPAFAGANASQAVLELERLKARALDLQDSLLKGLRRARTFTTRVEAATWELARELYRDGRRDDLLIQANPVLAANPFVVPAGTIIIVPPLT